MWRVSLDTVHFAEGNGDIEILYTGESFPDALRVCVQQLTARRVALTPESIEADADRMVDGVVVLLTADEDTAVDLALFQLSEEG